jgi:hypothetical protein
MTKDEVLRLAIEADLIEPRDIDNDLWGLPEAYVASLVKFARLVAAHERETCAKVCEQHWKHSGTAIECADAIRARGQG